MKYLTALIGAMLIWSGVLLYRKNDAVVHVYDKAIFRTPPPCLRLDDYELNATVRDKLSQHYRFSRTCPYLLHIDYKCDIRCNSPYNASRKIGRFPSAYLRIEIRKGMSLLFSYYIDLDDTPDSDTIEEAFENIVKTLRL